MLDPKSAVYRGNFSQTVRERIGWHATNAGSGAGFQPARVSSDRRLAHALAKPGRLETCPTVTAVRLTNRVASDAR
jgi:hypothetical protein